MNFPNTVNVFTEYYDLRSLTCWHQPFASQAKPPEAFEMSHLLDIHLVSENKHFYFPHHMPKDLGWPEVSDKKKQKTCGPGFPWWVDYLLHKNVETKAKVKDGHQPIRTTVKLKSLNVNVRYQLVWGV